MHIGLQINKFIDVGGAAAIAPNLKRIAQFADAHGFYSLWVMDHFFQMVPLGGPAQDMLEGYSALSYMAAITEHVKLGTLVTGVIYRYPGILAKTVTTLDVLSGGRAYLGIGAAWYEREARGLGVPYPPTAERFERLEETLQIMLQMWSDNNGAYSGTHYQLAETLNLPQVISRPHPPILIGGMGEKKTLRLVAQYADACNLFLEAGTSTLQAKLDALKAHCDAVGRDYAEIEKTGVRAFPPSRQPQDIVAVCRQAAQLGFTHVIFNMPANENIATLEMLATQVLPEVADL